MRYQLYEHVRTGQEGILPLTSDKKFPTLNRLGNVFWIPCHDGQPADVWRAEVPRNLQPTGEFTEALVDSGGPRYAVYGLRENVETQMGLLPVGIFKQNAVGVAPLTKPEFDKMFAHDHEGLVRFSLIIADMGELTGVETNIPVKYLYYYGEVPLSCLIGRRVGTPEVAIDQIGFTDDRVELTRRFAQEVGLPENLVVQALAQIFNAKIIRLPAEDKFLGEKPTGWQRYRGDLQVNEVLGLLASGVTRIAIERTKRISIFVEGAAIAIEGENVRLGHFKASRDGGLWQHYKWIEFPLAEFIPRLDPPSGTAIIGLVAQWVRLSTSNLEGGFDELLASMEQGEVQS
jgi:hypothetical protein